MFLNDLRTEPTIVIAHTFCESRDTCTRISYRQCLLIQGYFCTVQNYAEKAELSKCSWYPKKKIGGNINHAFFRDSKASFWQRAPYIALYFKAFLQIVLINYLRKMRGNPQFSFWISLILVRSAFPAYSGNRAKIPLN